MKLLPIPLSPLGPPPLGIWNSDLLWRYPPAPPSPLAELKTQLPSQLSADPRLWGREEVAIFLRWSEREFDLSKFDLEVFQMNGKALCLLTKNDLAERCPGAGDVLHNVLQMLIRDAQMLHRHLPSSPVTPTSRYPLSPHSHPPTPNWSALAPPDSPFFHNSHLQQFMAASNSVTLSPAPSVDSQAGSPPQNHQEQLQTVFQSTTSHTQASSAGSSSNQSDSDEETSTYHNAKHSLAPLHHPDKTALLSHHQQSPPLTPITKETQNLGQLQLMDTKSLQSYTSNSNTSNSSSNYTSSTVTTTSATSGPAGSIQPSSGAFMPVVKREFGLETTEPNTNGRLLWDFLQQLLNDPAQRYSSYIAWKCRDTGVFKIVDPAGLAKLWGKQKNHLSMNYDKMSRALRYYYRVNILRKVQGERHCYQFLRNPTELKSIKNISMLRQTMTAAANNEQNQNHQANEANTTTNHSLISLIATNPNIHHLALAAQQASANQKLQAAVAARNIKMETDVDDMKPTDLSTSRSTNNTECYPLIRNSNGLTTIQLMRQHHMNSTSENSSPPTSPSPLTINTQSLNTITSNLQHLQQQKQKCLEQGSKSDDEAMMPTDLSKTDQAFYK